MGIERTRVCRYRGGFALEYYVGGCRYRRALGSGTLQAAHAEAATLIRAIDLAMHERLTVGAIVGRYLERSRAIGKETLAAHWRAAATSFDAADPVMAGDVARQHERERLKQVKPATVAKELGVVRAALRWAVKEGLIERAPHIDMPPATPPRDRRLTRDEVVSLRAAAQDDHLRLFIDLAWSTAARAGAILELTWADVDLEGRRINYRAAGRMKRRTIVPIGDDLAGILLAARARASGPAVIEYAGRPVASIKKAFRAAVARAGLVDVSPHVLRHSAAAALAEAGVALEVIAQYLGHSSPSVTYRVYARFSPHHLAAAAEALGTVRKKR